MDRLGGCLLFSGSLYIPTRLGMWGNYEFVIPCRTEEEMLEVHSRNYLFYDYASYCCRDRETNEVTASESTTSIRPMTLKYERSDS